MYHIREQAHSLRHSLHYYSPVVIVISLFFTRILFCLVATVYYDFSTPSLLLYSLCVVCAFAINSTSSALFVCSFSLPVDKNWHWAPVRYKLKCGAHVRNSFRLLLHLAWKLFLKHSLSRVGVGFTIQYRKLVCVCTNWIIFAIESALIAIPLHDKKLYRETRGGVEAV